VTIAQPAQPESPHPSVDASTEPPFPRLLSPSEEWSMADQEAPVASTTKSGPLPRVSFVFNETFRAELVAGIPPFCEALPGPL
jgi:hypothetical protein